MACAASDDGPPSSSDSETLLVVGPGVLGGLVGKLYKDKHRHAEVVGQTNTDSNHDRLRRLGLTPRLKASANEQQFANVVFSAPPSGSADYVGEVKKAIQCWDRTNVFVFTSSSAVFDTKGTAVITESTPLQKLGTSDRIDRLLKAEQAVLEAGGCVLRLVGLYHLNRGAHTFFLRQGEVQRAGNHIVNLIHYEDAASLVLKILDSGSKGKCFLGTDGSPVTFQEMMDATLQHESFSGAVSFTAPDEAQPAPGSSNQDTCRLLKWQPHYGSFLDFMHSNSSDFYSQSDQG